MTKEPRLPIALRALLVMVLALFPTTLVQLHMEREAREERTQQIGIDAMRLVRLVAGQQTRMLEGASQLLSAMAAHEAVRAGVNSAECDAYVARLLAAYPRYHSANVFDREGRTLCSPLPNAAGAKVSDQRYFRMALAGQPFVVGGYMVEAATGLASLYLYAPLRRDDGEIIGVVVAALSVDWLNQDLRAMDLPAGSIATLADRDGVVVARTRETARFVGTTLPDRWMDLVNAPGPALIDLPSLEGLRRIAAIIPVGDEPQGLLVAVGLDGDAAIAAEVTRQRRTAILIVGALVLTLALATLFFQATVERPIRQLLDAAQLWARQDWRARVGRIAGGGREFAPLAAAFDRMAEEVQIREAARDRANTRMRALVEVSPQIVFTADQAGNMTWLNGYWRELTGLPEAEALGMGWLAAVHPDDHERIRIAWAAAIADAQEAGHGGYGIEIRLCRAQDQAWRWFLNKAAPIRDTDGHVTGWTGVAIDFHDLRAAQSEAAEGAARLRATYENAPVGLCLFDPDLRFVAINGVLAAANGARPEDHIGRTLGEIAPRMAPMIVPLLRRVIETGQSVEDVEVAGQDAGQDGEDRVWLCSYRPVRGVGGDLIGISGAVLDITARKLSQEAERLLSQEVDHRAKNALAVVRSLIRLSVAQATEDMPALVEVLEGRIAAMARVHTVLAREKWVAADLREIVTQELGSHLATTTIEGPPVRLCAEAAQPLTLVLHELVTNAAKYGALSVPEGRLAVRWSVTASGALLEWRETDGPPIDGVPSHSGFGSQLIEANAGTQLDGGITRYWEPQGLRCALRIGPGAIMGRVIGGADPVLTGRRVLLVDDDRDNAAQLAEALRLAGCEVVGPVGTAAEAIALIHNTGLDAAVLTVAPGGRSVQPVLDLVRRRAATVVLLAPDGVAAEAGSDLPVLTSPTSAQALMGLLRAAFVSLRPVA